MFRLQRNAKFHLEVRVKTVAFFFFFFFYSSSWAHSVLVEAIDVMLKTPTLEKVTREGLTEKVTFQW